jgi:hypothetical protein
MIADFKSEITNRKFRETYNKNVTVAKIALFLEIGGFFLTFCPESDTLLLTNGRVVRRSFVADFRL